MADSEVAKMFIAIPRALHDWLHAEAKREERSLNTTVVRLIRDRMQAQQREAVTR